MFDSCERFS
jgi:hypothetical protein